MSDWGPPRHNATDGTETACAVLFADIAGSTRLYQTLGDTRARFVIGSALSLLAWVAAEHDGVVIKTMGDEVMCRFPSADSALEAASRMQDQLRQRPVEPAHPVTLRIGTHHGAVIFGGEDVFGDAVNVAARLRDIARAGQVITTLETVNRASEALKRRTRHIDRAVLPGRSTLTDVYELLWDPLANVTVLTPVQDRLPARSPSWLELRYQSVVQRVDTAATVRIGRDAVCEVVVTSELASRQHARIEHRGGKFVLTDQSTNGTYVQCAAADEVYVRRESVPLSGEGTIGVGCPSSVAGPHAIRFACH